MENNILKKVKEVFPESIYHIEYDEDYNKLTVSINKTECFKLEISEYYIYVIHINQCGIVSGTDLIKKIDKLAEKIPKIKYIELRDGSNIKINNIEIDLAFLKILTKGESWYNSLGYVSNEYNEEKTENEKLRNTPLIEVLDLCKPILINEFEDYIDFFEDYIDISIENNIPNDEKNRIVEEKIENLKIKIKEHFLYINENLTVKVFFEIVNNLIENTKNYYVNAKQDNLGNNTKRRKLNTQLTVEQTKILKELIQVIGILIKYNGINLKKMKNESKKCESSCNVMGGKLVKSRMRKSKRRNKSKRINNKSKKHTTKRK